MTENVIRIPVSKERGVDIPHKMIGLFFEDINYAADGGLYAEMLENRAFNFVKAQGDKCDYYVEPAYEYGWSPYPHAEGAEIRSVTGSPRSHENPCYLRVCTTQPGQGIGNKAYDGICLKKGMDYAVRFIARNVNFIGNYTISAECGGKRYGQVQVGAEAGQEETFNRFRTYTAILKAEESVRGADFLITLDGPGIVEFDYISMIPTDAVAGVFRKDLFDRLKSLQPGFLRFPGGCIVEGNTLSNRYRFKDSLKPAWDRPGNWNRWAVHENSAQNHYKSQYAHYNQTLGLGYYEYFLLCEMIGADPLPVLNVGFACQYQSEEMADINSPQFREYVQDALDLIEFANGGADTKWGAVRKEMGHAEPFHLTMVGVGNEQWQTKKADFFERYIIFEKAIHEHAPQMKLIGSAGPDITSERYQMAWDFYRANQDKKDFVYAVDEHYYVKPQWLFDHVNFYDDYSRNVKVFSGEYAAHPFSGMNRPDANTLEGALAEAAFMTGVERNADVVVLASYAPLFARAGYAQWSPDMIWFDDEGTYATPSYYVQQMYARNMGTATLATGGAHRQAASDKVYYSLSIREENQEIIAKIVNANTDSRAIRLELDGKWGERKSGVMTILTGEDKDGYNKPGCEEQILPYETECELEQITVPAQSFTVINIKQ